MDESYNIAGKVGLVPKSVQLPLARQDTNEQNFFLGSRLGAGHFKGW
jgi:hypothetical protein